MLSELGISARKKAAHRAPIWTTPGRNCIIFRAGAESGDERSSEAVGTAFRPERGPESSDLDGSWTKLHHFSSRSRIQRRERPRGLPEQNKRPRFAVSASLAMCVSTRSVSETAFRITPRTVIRLASDDSN